MKFANKLTAKAMLAVALLGVGGATISAVQHKTGDNVAHADTPVRRYYEYRRIRGRLYYRSVLKAMLTALDGYMTALALGFQLVCNKLL